MTGPELEQVVTQLPHYGAYSEAAARVDAERARLPQSLNPRSFRQIASHLQAPQSEADLQEPRAQLMLEVTQAQKAIALPYRLGVLAVIDKPLRPPKYGRLVDIAAHGVPNQNDDIPLSEFAWPPVNPFERAARIGSCITEIVQKVSSTEETPLAYLVPDRLQPNQTRPTIATYYLAEPDGLDLKGPCVIKNTEGSTVRYSLPRILCTEARYDAAKEMFVKKNDMHTADKPIAPPQLSQLTGSRRAACLRFGEDALAFAQKYHKARTEHATHPSKKRDILSMRFGR